MTLSKALQIVLELAKQNLAPEDARCERQRQEKALELVMAMKQGRRA